MALHQVRRCRQCNNLMTFADPERTRQQNTMALVVVFFAVLVLLAIFLPLLFRLAR